MVVLRGVVLQRGVLRAFYRDAATGRLHSLGSSPRRVAEWLVLHYPEAVRAVRAPASHSRLVATCLNLPYPNP